VIPSIELSLQIASPTLQVATPALERSPQSGESKSSNSVARNDVQSVARPVFHFGMMRALLRRGEPNHAELHPGRELPRN